MNGRKADDQASCCVNSRHWVFETIAAFNMTLTTLPPNIIANHGVGVWMGGQGTTGGRPANAVSMGSQAVGITPHVTAKVALAGITEGAQKNMAAIIAVVTILRKFIVVPEKSAADAFTLASWTCSDNPQVPTGELAWRQRLSL